MLVPRGTIDHASPDASRKNENPPMPPTIRLATPDDAEQVQALYAPYCFTPISFEMEPPSVEEMRGRLAKVLGHYPWLVYEEGGEVLGYAYATQHRVRRDHHHA
jgi:L-amino acid N-acyltransferase YncA